MNSIGSQHGHSYYTAAEHRQKRKGLENVIR